MIKNNGSGLHGMKEICNYTNRSESTIIQWIQLLGFPARKMKPGGWESDKNLIDAWRIDQIKAKNNVVNP